MFDFDSVDDYYIKSSSVRDIANLKIPSLFLNAHNDKLSPVDTIDLEQTFRKNDNLILLLTRWGGHVCWFHGLRKPKRVHIFKIF
jgi:predicted alpha/beta-fold hydrolase